MGKAKRKRSTNSSPTSPDSVYHYKSVNVKKAKRKRSTYVTPTISDSVDLFCQHCSTDDLHMEASHYCEVCKAYMCDSCIEYHQDSKDHRYHRPMYSKHYMPKDKMIPRTLDTPTQTCPKHSDKILEYFCDIHKDLCCKVCLNMDHIACKKKSYVPYISSQTANTREYKNLLIKLDWLIDMATRQQMHIKMDQQDNESYHTKAMSDIKMGLESKDESFDQQVKYLVQKVADLHQSNAKSIDTAAHKCQTVLSDVRQMRLDFDDQEKGRKNNQLFVGMKLAHIHLHTVEDEISAVMEHKISRYTFNQDEEEQETTSTPSADHPAPQIENMQQSSDHSASQIANMQQSTACLLSMRHDGGNTKARYLREVRVKKGNDEYDCHITGIELLPGDRMVVIDWENYNVKLVDIKRNKITSMLSLSGPRGKRSGWRGTGRPSAVTRTTSNQIAVSLSQDKKIEIVTVTDVLSRNHTIQVPGDYFCDLCFDGQHFFLLYPSERAVKKVDMSGRVVSTLFTESDSDRCHPLRKNSEHIALSRNKDILYLTDEIYPSPGHTVTCLTLTGQVVAIYSHAMLDRPSGMAVGGDGCVYVCGQASHSVHQLTASGRHITVLLDRQPDLAKLQRAKSWNEGDNDDSWLCDKDPSMVYGPEAIALNAENDTLAIGRSQRAKFCNFVSLYKLEQIVK